MNSAKKIIGEFDEDQIYCDECAENDLMILEETDENEPETTEPLKYRF